MGHASTRGESLSTRGGSLSTRGGSREQKGWAQGVGHVTFYLQFGLYPLLLVVRFTSKLGGREGGNEQ